MWWLLPALPGNPSHSRSTSRFQRLPRNGGTGLRESGDATHTRAHTRCATRPSAAAIICGASANHATYVRLGGRLPLGSLYQPLVLTGACTYFTLERELRLTRPWIAMVGRQTCGRGGRHCSRHCLVACLPHRLAIIPVCAANVAPPLSAGNVILMHVCACVCVRASRRLRRGGCRFDRYAFAGRFVY